MENFAKILQIGKLVGTMTILNRRLFPKRKKPEYFMGSFFQLTISLRMVHFSYNFYNFAFSYNSYLPYEVVFLHHL